MAVTYRDRYKTTITNNASTSYDYVIGSASTNFLTFNSSDDNLNFSIVVTEGDKWEIADGCLYTHSTTTLGRGTLVNSSVYPSRPNFTSAATIAVTLLAKDIVNGTTTSTSLVQQYVRNANGSSITKGQPVYLKGSTSGYVTIALAGNGSEQTSSKTFGLAAENMANNALGYVTCEGLLENIDTSAASAEGDPVWLGPSGTLIYGLANKPSAPEHLVYIGVVVTKHASTGRIFIKVSNGWEIEELHNVSISSPTNLDVLRYDNSVGLWKNNTLSDKQDTLVSGTNIKTINGTSILGSGDVTISGGASSGLETIFLLMGA